jgi:GTPase SAR1 family protein
LSAADLWVSSFRPPCKVWQPTRIAGKSSLTVQYVDGHFVDSYYPTIENTFSKIIKHKNQDFAVEIIDTAGQVRHETTVEKRALLTGKYKRMNTPS